MNSIASRALVASVVTAAVCILGAVAIVVTLETLGVGPQRVPVYGFYLDMFKTVLAGFLVAMLGVLIPAMIGEAHYAFQRMKESRIAYSEAKTGIDYLKLRLATMTLGEASACLQKVHFQKHLAELYDEFVVHLRKRYGPEMTPYAWDLMMYERLFLTREILEAEADHWEQLTPDERIELLSFALPTESQVELSKRYVRSARPRAEPIDREVPDS